MSGTTQDETGTTTGTRDQPAATEQQVKRFSTAPPFLAILSISTGSHPLSFSAPLAAAAGALVLLDVLRLCRGDPDALAMEPLLANVAADPEFAVCIGLPTRAAQVCLVLILNVLPTTVILVFWLGWLCRLAVRIGLS